MKTRHGLEYSIVAMSKYKGKYEFYKISTDLIKIYGNKIYLIVFKLVVLFPAFLVEFSKSIDKLNNILLK